MGNKVRVRARASRGTGIDESLQGLKQLLVEDYDNTKAEYDALNDDHRAQFDAVLGDLSAPFQQGAVMVEMQLNLIEAAGDADERFENLNKLLD